MKKIIPLILTVVLMIFCFVSCNDTILCEEMESDSSFNDSSSTEKVPDDFSFSIVWGMFGTSSYNSETGRLIKTTDATNPDDYVTTHILSDEELKSIYRIIKELNFEIIDEFGPDDFNGSDPHLSLSLTVKTNGLNKTIKVKEAASYNSANTPNGKNFLEAVKAIKDILENTQEWKALPDYEFYYH